jgi:hypothetical protein
MRPPACRAVDSEIIQHSEPSWNALLDAVGEHLSCGFMWMHEEELDDGTAVHAYKHRSTRRYLYLADDGRAFVCTGCDRLAEIRLDWAIERALLPWALRDHCTVEDRDAIRDALERTQDPRPEVTW